MSDCVVWLDSEKAHIYALKEGCIEKSMASKSGMDHHRRHDHDESKDGHSEHYYQDLAGHLKYAEKLLLIGPGLAKDHFKSYLEKYESHNLAKKIIGIENFESFEHKTENQMLAKARKVFKTYNLFNDPM